MHLAQMILFHLELTTGLKDKTLMYIWQYSAWTEFTYQTEQIEPLLRQIMLNQKRLLGNAKILSVDLDRQAQMDALIQNALKTSEIEGELLNVGSVRSSVARHLGIEFAGRVAATQQTDSLINLLTTATSELTSKLCQNTLCQWQAALFSEPSIVHKIKVGELRDDKPMQVISQRKGRNLIHFEAPPSKGLEQQLEQFIRWFNRYDINDTKQNIIRAALAHLWFITLHPFEDGNGRVARVLTDRALAQAEQSTVRFYALSGAIEQDRSGYYDILQATQSVKTAHQNEGKQANNVTDWLLWFLKTLNRAIVQGLQRIERVVNKTRFWQVHSQTVLTARQVKVLNRLLDASEEEFESGINARKYQSIAGVSKATATRDLAELVVKNCLEKLPGGGRSTRYSIASS
jgi:Fic family protein